MLHIKLYLFFQILPERCSNDDERSIDEMDDAVGDRDVGLDDVGDDVLAAVMTVALNCVRLHLNWKK